MNGGKLSPYYPRICGSSQRKNFQIQGVCNFNNHWYRRTRPYRPSVWCGVGSSLSSTFHLVWLDQILNIQRNHNSQKPHLRKGFRGKTCRRDSSPPQLRCWRLRLPSSSSPSPCDNNHNHPFMHLIVILNPSMDLHMYLFNPSYYIHSSMMMLFASMFE
jgi:hypothetical protein